MNDITQNSALIDAVSAKDFEKVRELIESGADASAQSYLSVKVSVQSRSDEIFFYLVAQRAPTRKVWPELLRLAIIHHQDRIIEHIVLGSDVEPQRIIPTMRQTQHHFMIKGYISEYISGLLQMRSEMAALQKLPTAVEPAKTYKV